MKDIKDTAKLIRKSLKAAYKGFKFSVTISRYSLGQSLSVEIKALPASFGPVLNAEIDETYGVRLMTGTAANLRKAVEALVSSFNGGEFYSCVSFASAIRR